MGDPSVVCTQLGGTAGQNGSCVLSPPDQTVDLKDWKTLLNFRPQAVIDTIKSHFPDATDPYYHPIEDGKGALNLDFYAVQITQLPTFDGTTPITPEALVGYIRNTFNNYLDQSNSVFTIYDADVDNAKWSSSNPLGTVGNFNIQGAPVPRGASVILSDYASDHWIFSTLPTPVSMRHPVSGNRQFGYAVLGAGQSLSDVYQKAGVTLDNKNGDALYFYTRGADRVTTVADYVFSATNNLVFAGGHALWLGLQQRVVAWILQRGGQAVVAGNVSERWDWDGIRSGGLAGSLWTAPPR